MPNMRTDAAPLVEARGLTKDYPCDGGVTRVVDDVSFAIQPGETLGLVGESGSRQEHRGAHAAAPDRAHRPARSL